MQLNRRPMGAAISAEAKERLANARAFPTLDTWRNPVTRPIARRLANDAFEKTLREIDFDYRITETCRGETDCVRYEADGARNDGAQILFVHGGAFLTGGPAQNAASVLPLCALTGLTAIGPRYALAPEARYPAALDQIDRVYRAMICERDAKPVVLFAESTGCSLALANLLRWRDEDVRTPAAVILISPSLDAEGASDTHVALDGRDPFIRSLRGKTVRKLYQYYAPGENLADPMISPLNGDLSGLPPILTLAGAREVLLGDAARLSMEVRRAGGDAQMHVYDGMFHLFHMHWSIAETKTAFRDMADFIDRTL